MKSVTFKVLLSLFMIALCSRTFNAKLVKSWGQYERELGMKPVQEIKHGRSRPSARKLTEDEPEEIEQLPKKQTGLEFLQIVITIVLDKLDLLLGLKHQMTGEKYIYVRNNQVLLTVEFELKDEEVMKFQYVEIQFVNAVIQLELKMEKTKMEGYVADYMLFYTSNAVISIQQTVLTIDDISMDLGLMLNYVCETSRDAKPLIFTKYKGKPKPKQEERELHLISKTHDNLERALKNKPIYSAIKVLPLDMKNKKYISSKPGVMEYIKNLELPPSPRYEPRARQLTNEGEEVGDLRKDHETLKPGHSHFLVNKLSSFNENTMQNKDNLRLGVGRIEKISENELRFPFYTSRSNTLDLMGYFKVKGANQPMEFTIISPSFEIVLKIYVQTKRYGVKQTRIMIEKTVVIVQIFDHLNDLRVWRDFWPGHTKHQWRVHELIQPSVIYMMYREMFDNMSDGQTAQANPEDEGILHYTHTVTDNGEAGIWDFNVYSDSHHMLSDRITSKTMGEDFPTAYMTGEMFLNDGIEQGIYFGNREVPEESMFNQHFILKKHMELQVEFIIRSSPEFIDYKDDITPFITDAYNYVDLDDAPEVRNPDPKRGLRGYKYSTDVVGANKLEVKTPGDHIIFKLCAVLSTEYHDNIQLTRDGYIFVGGRFFFRKDVDYCYEVTNPSEDRLKLLQQQHENPGEEDRILKEISLGQLV